MNVALTKSNNSITWSLDDYGNSSAQNVYSPMFMVDGYKANMSYNCEQSLVTLRLFHSEDNILPPDIVLAATLSYRRGSCRSVCINDLARIDYISQLLGENSSNVQDNRALTHVPISVSGVCSGAFVAFNIPLECNDVAELALLDPQLSVCGMQFPEESSGHSAGIQAHGSMCYLCSAFQLLYSIPALRSLVVGHFLREWNCHTSPLSSTLYSLGHVFAEMLFHSKIASTSNVQAHMFTRNVSWGSFNFDSQHDVSEFIQLLFQHISEEGVAATHAALMDPDVVLAINKLVIAKINPRNNTEHESPPENHFLINLSLSDSLMDSLCNTLGTTDDSLRATRALCLSPPPLLMLGLNRLAFDSATLSLDKLHSRCDADLVIDVSQFCASSESPDDSSLYFLHAVICHIGQASGGHYVCYLSPVATNPNCIGSNIHDTKILLESSPWTLADNERISQVSYKQVKASFGVVACGDDKPTLSTTACFFLYVRFLCKDTLLSDDHGNLSTDIAKYFGFRRRELREQRRNESIAASLAACKSSSVEIPYIDIHAFTRPAINACKMRFRGLLCDSVQCNKDLGLQSGLPSELFHKSCFFIVSYSSQMTPSLPLTIRDFCMPLDFSRGQLRSEYCVVRMDQLAGCRHHLTFVQVVVRLEDVVKLLADFLLTHSWPAGLQSLNTTNSENVLLAVISAITRVLAVSRVIPFGFLLITDDEDLGSLKRRLYYHCCWQFLRDARAKLDIICANTTVTYPSHITSFRTLIENATCGFTDSSIEFPYPRDLVLYLHVDNKTFRPLAASLIYNGCFLSLMQDHSLHPDEDLPDYLITEADVLASPLAFTSLDIIQKTASAALQRDPPGLLVLQIDQKISLSFTYMHDTSLSSDTRLSNVLYSTLPSTNLLRHSQFIKRVIHRNLGHDFLSSAYTISLIPLKTVSISVRLTDTLASITRYLFTTLSSQLFLTVHADTLDAMASCQHLADLHIQASQTSNPVFSLTVGEFVSLFAVDAGVKFLSVVNEMVNRPEYVHPDALMLNGSGPSSPLYQYAAVLDSFPTGIVAGKRMCNLRLLTLHQPQMENTHFRLLTLYDAITRETSDQSSQRRSIDISDKLMDYYGLSPVTECHPVYRKYAVLQTLSCRQYSRRVSLLKSTGQVKRMLRECDDHDSRVQRALSHIHTESADSFEMQTLHLSAIPTALTLCYRLPLIGIHELPVVIVQRIKIRLCSVVARDFVMYVPRVDSFATMDYICESITKTFKEFLESLSALFLSLGQPPTIAYAVSLCSATGWVIRVLDDLDEHLVSLVGYPSQQELLLCFDFFPLPLGLGSYPKRLSKDQVLALPHFSTSDRVTGASTVLFSSQPEYSRRQLMNELINRYHIGSLIRTSVDDYSTPIGEQLDVAVGKFYPFVSDVFTIASISTSAIRSWRLGTYAQGATGLPTATASGSVSDERLYSAGDPLCVIIG